MAVPEDRRVRLATTTGQGSPESTSQSDFNEDDYLAGRISVGFVSNSRHLILSQNSLTRESPTTDRRSSRNEMHQKFSGSSTSQKTSEKAAVNDNNDFVQGATRPRPTVNIKASHSESVQLGQKCLQQSDAGADARTKQRQNNETLLAATCIKSVNKDIVGGTAQVMLNDRGKHHSRESLRAQPQVNEAVCATPEAKKEKVCLKEGTKRRVDVETCQKKIFHHCGTSKDMSPVQISTREATCPKTDGKEMVQLKNNSDNASVKLDIKDEQKPSIKVDSPHTVHNNRKICDETSISPCNDKQTDNETEETTDTDKVYNYLYYIGTRIPSKSFSRLCRSVNKQTMPSSSSSSSPSSSTSSP